MTKLLIGFLLGVVFIGVPTSAKAASASADIEVTVVNMPPGTYPTKKDHLDVNYNLEWSSGGCEAVWETGYHSGMYQHAFEDLSGSEYVPSVEFIHGTDWFHHTGGYYRARGYIYDLNTEEMLAEDDDIYECSA